MNPLIKWTGGKRWLVPILADIWQAQASSGRSRRLVEPFTGGMAVALGLNPQYALLNDANVHLINLYRQVVLGLQIKQCLHNTEDFYYATRQRFNDCILRSKHCSPTAAAYFYYLIRTGFNGLCRFNNRGLFNVPFGRHTSIIYKKNFNEYQPILQRWQFTHGDFADLALDGTEFIYADPPYDVTFTRYTQQDFVWIDQVRLAKWLASHVGPVIASNQATARVLALYEDLGFKIYVLPAPRMIACNGNRQPALEMLAVKHVNAKVLRKLDLYLKH